MRTAGIAIAAAVTLGCYTYVPAELDAVPVGSDVRGLLSTEARLALRDTLGQDLATLRATLVAREPGRLLLAVRSNEGEPRYGSRALFQHVALAPGDVLRVELRQLDRPRTIATAVLAAAGVAAIVAYVLEATNPGDPGNGGGGGSELVRVRLP